MSDPGDVETRLAAVEQEVARLRAKLGDVAADAAAARVLARGADRDVSDVSETLRVHTQLLNALRETQVEQGQRLDALNQRLGGVEGRVGGVEQQVISIDQRMSQGFATLGEGMTRIHTLLERIAPEG